MAASKKPSDETLKGVPDFAQKKDTYSEPITDSTLVMMPGHRRPTGTSLKPTEAAPEVSQGAWRERAFTPRGVMPKNEILEGLETALRLSLAHANLPALAFQQLRREWMPFLRQAMEQAGGDGMDAWLLTALKPPGRRAMDPFLGDLISNVGRLRAARDLAGFEEDALKAIEGVRKILNLAKPRRLSFKQMERELEGKLEVDELMLIFFSDDHELSKRLEEIGKTMESLRDQIRTRPGAKPDGMYANFARMKAELRVLNGEMTRRTPPKTP